MWCPRPPFVCELKSFDVKGRIEGVNGLEGVMTEEEEEEGSPPPTKLLRSLKLRC